MQSRMAKALALAIFLLSLGETLILHWGWMAFRGHGLSALQWGIGIVGIGLINALLYPLARRSIRARGLRLVLSRGWIMGSIAALLTGLVLGLVFALVGTAGTLLGGGALRQLALIWCGGLVVAVGFGATLWGATVGNLRVRVDRIPLRVAGIPNASGPVSIAQITDLHIGPLLQSARLAAFVRRINALEPDLIVITGDIFDFDPCYVEEGCRELAKLEARHGVYAVLGNHDHYTGLDVVVRGLRDLTGIRLLRDEWVPIEIAGGVFALAGLEDPGASWMERESESAELGQLATEVPEGMPSVLLVHRPSYFRQAQRLGFPLVLSGHTPGGQVALPIVHNLNPSRMIANHTRGVYEVGGSIMYVSRGLGMAGLPLRINCPREIALLELRG